METAPAMMMVELQYGADRQFNWKLPADCAATFVGGPEDDVEVLSATQASLAQPLELPPLRVAIVPGDQVVIALEREAAILHTVVAALWSELAEAGVQPADVTLLQPAELPGHSRRDPRDALPSAIRDAVKWLIHDPTADESCGYLASSATGERIYLSRVLLDADFIIPVSVAGFDPLLGYKAPGGVFYPGLSNLEAFKKAHGQGHQELRPEDERPVRQLIEEAGWLLGVQYAVQVLPSARRGQATEILVGSCEAVARRARKLLDRNWRARLPERIETVIASIPADSSGVTWAQLGSALQAAKSLVERRGRIIVLSDLAAEPGSGVRVIRDHRSARAALQPLRALAPEDLIAATQLAAAADWATVYLLSGLEPGMVEDLFCTPLESEAELERLLAGVETCVILGAAQHVYGEITPS